MELIATAIGTGVFVASFFYCLTISVCICLDDSKTFWCQILPPWQWLYGASFGVILSAAIDLID